MSLMDITPYPRFADEESVLRALSSQVQVCNTLSPYGKYNKVSIMLNKTQAKFLIRALQKALDKESDYCTKVVKVKNVIVRNPHSVDLPPIMHDVEGDIMLDNY
jgi:hypothetical protein